MTDQIGQYRAAHRVRKGWQVRDVRGSRWHTVVDLLRVYSPLNFVRFTFADGTAATAAPNDDVFCRTAAEVKKAEAAS